MKRWDTDGILPLIIAAGSIAYRYRGAIGSVFKGLGKSKSRVAQSLVASSDEEDEPYVEEEEEYEEED